MTWACAWVRGRPQHMFPCKGLFVYIWYASVYSCAPRLYTRFPPTKKNLCYLWIVVFFIRSSGCPDLNNGFPDNTEHFPCPDHCPLSLPMMLSFCRNAEAGSQWAILNCCAGLIGPRHIQEDRWVIQNPCSSFHVLTCILYIYICIYVYIHGFICTVLSRISDPPRSCNSMLGSLAPWILGAFGTRPLESRCSVSVPWLPERGWTCSRGSHGLTLMKIYNLGHWVLLWCFSYEGGHCINLIPPSTPVPQLTLPIPHV
jgi:hypothetical protein